MILYMILTIVFYYLFYKQKSSSKKLHIIQVVEYN